MSLLSIAALYFLSLPSCHGRTNNIQLIRDRLGQSECRFECPGTNYMRSIKAPGSADSWRHWVVNFAHTLFLSTLAGRREFCGYALAVWVRDLIFHSFLGLVVVVLENAELACEVFLFSFHCGSTYN